MISKVVMALLAMGLAATFSRPAQTQTSSELAWRFQQGEEFSLVVVDDFKSIAIQAGQSFEIPQQRTYEFAVRVPTVSADGSAQLEVELKRVRLHSRVPFSGEVDLDSKAVDPAAPDSIKELQKTFGKVVGMQFSCRMSARGEISATTLTQELPAEVKALPLLAGLLQTSELEAALSSPGQLPNGDFGTDEAWSYETTRPTPAGKLVFTSHLTVIGPNETNKEQIDLATKTEVRLELQSDTDDADYSIKDAQIGGTASYSPSTGKILSAQRQQRFTLVVEKDGVTAEQKVSRMTEYSLKPKSN